MALKTDYKDYVPNSIGKLYTITDAGGGKSSIVDATTYETVGDTFNAGVINATNTQVNKNTHTQASATLTVAGWSNNSQTISVTGVTASNIVFVSPAPASHSAYGESGVYCSAQAAGKLTFKCTDKPTVALTVNVVSVG